MTGSRTYTTRFAAFLALALGACALVAAQAQPQAAPAAPAPKQAGRQALARLNLEPKELDQIEKILDKDEEAIAKARAEIRIDQAKLARLLLEREVPMDQVQALVKQSLDWEYQVRMIQIGRQMEIKKVLGDERWAELFRLGRAAQGKEAAKALGAMEKNRRERLLAIMKRLN